MDAKKIDTVLNRFVTETKNTYGKSLKKIILYGSCARGDYQEESDIDIMVLLDCPLENLPLEREKLFGITDDLDMGYEVVLAPVVQSYDVFLRYLPASGFFQNVQKEGVTLA